MIGRLTAKLCRAYGAARFNLPVDWFSYEKFLEVLVRNINMKSSPGIPWCHQAATNGQLLKWDGISVDDTMARVLWAEVQRHVENNEWNPYRVFIKDEPHKVAKARLGRWRLIFAGSITDQVLDHMLFRYQNELEIANWMHVPSKGGWNPMAGGCRYMQRSFERPWAVDKSSWDWTAPAWVFDVICEHRIQMCGNPDQLWKRLVRDRYRYVFKDAVVQLSCGLKFQQKDLGGLMKSGFVNTFSDNSKAQVLLHWAASYSCGLVPGKIYSLGDDTLQEKVEHPKYLEFLEDFGCLIKESEDGLYFGGFDCGRMLPLYGSKHRKNLAYLPPADLPSALRSYVGNYAMDLSEEDCSEEPGTTSFLASLLRCQRDIDPDAWVPPEVLRAEFLYGD